LLGRHLLELGLEPGPRMGEITKAIYEMQLDGRIRDLEEAKHAASALITEAH
jgi:tRNA nucleotidyltransferase (CCA-adding enzyme)